jgi:hypothetical protein
VKLPNGDRAIVDLQKLTAYCLNEHHSRGRHKARVFAARGVLESDADELRTALLHAAAGSEAQLGLENLFGQRYIIDFKWIRESQNISLRSTWIIRMNEEIPRLTSCYVL